MHRVYVFCLISVLAGSSLVRQHMGKKQPNLALRYPALVLPITVVANQEVLTHLYMRTWGKLSSFRPM